jgi:hypothetical protein
MQLYAPASNYRMKALFYGEPGAGKSRLAATAADSDIMGPIFVISWGPGTDSYDGYDVAVLPVNSLKQLSAALNWFSDGKHPFKTLVIDEYSEVHKAKLSQIQKEEARQGKMEDTFQQQDYGKALNYMRNLTDKLRLLPYHVILIAHTREIPNPRVGNITLPGFPGQFAREVQGYCSIVGYLTIKDTAGSEQIRQLQIDGSKTVNAKFRVGKGQKVPLYVDNPTISKLIELRFAAR